MEKNEKISWTQHNNKLRSAGNDWRRALMQTPRKRQRKWNQERDKENGTKKEINEMERTLAVIFTSIFTLFHFTHLLALFCLTFYRFNAKRSRSWSQGPPTAERKTQRKLSGHILFLQLFLLYLILHLS